MNIQNTTFMIIFYTKINWEISTVFVLLTGNECEIKDYEYLLSFPKNK